MASGGPNLRALRYRLRTLKVATARDPRATLLVTLAGRMDSGEFTAHDAQQYRLALDALERASTSTAGSTTDRLREQRLKREQEAARARGAQGQSDTAT